MTTSQLISPFLAALLTAQVSFSTAVASNSVAESIIKSRQILAKKGNADAQFKLASMYELGIGTNIDIPQATHWYSQATKTGYSDARKRLSYLDIKKNGFDKKAHSKWLKNIKKDAKANSSQSLMILGQLYSYGLGVPKDMDEAFRLLNSANLNNPVVLFELDRIDKERQKISALQKQRKAEVAKQKIDAQKQQALKKKATAQKKVLSKAEKRRRYEATMAKLREEERILEEEQAWAEGKSTPKTTTAKAKTNTAEQNAKSRRYVEMMRKLKEEERIMNEQQAWAETN